MRHFFQKKAAYQLYRVFLLLVVIWTGCDSPQHQQYDPVADCERTRQRLLGAAYKVEFGTLRGMNLIRVKVDKEKERLGICNTDVQLLLAGNWMPIDSIYYEAKGRIRVMNFLVPFAGDFESFQQFRDSLEIRYWTDR